MGENSILTQTQREFLRLEADQRKEEYSKQQRHYHRTSITERLDRVFDDLELLLEAGAEGEALDLGTVLGDTDAGRVWPLTALLFEWATHHPTLVDVDDFTDAVSTPGEDVSRQTEINRVTASFDRAIETGVRAALEFGDDDRVPEDVSNELSISVGASVSEMDQEELASLPRRTLDLLFRRGDLDHEEYAAVMERKLEREE